MKDSITVNLEFTCVICLVTPFKNPVTLVCGHTFCELCTYRCMNLRKSCPVCRYDIQEQYEFHQNITIKNMIKTMFNDENDNMDVLERSELILHKQIQNYKKDIQRLQLEESYRKLEQKYILLLHEQSEKIKTLNKKIQTYEQCSKTYDSFVDF